MAQSTESLLPTLEKYVHELKKTRDLHPQTMPQPTILVAQATSTAPGQPLSKHDANVLTDLFPSIRLLEEATRSTAGRETITEWFDPSTGRNMIDFWEDEWIV